MVAAALRAAVARRALLHRGPRGRRRTLPTRSPATRFDKHWPDGVAADVLRVLELQAVDDDAEAAMWSYLFGIDLVGTITAADRPVDDPLRWRLADPRRLRVRQLRDHLWVRVVDVAAALAARTYGADDALVLELIDDFRPENSGCWLVDGGPDGATCARTDRAADLALSAADLGALYLGGVPVSTLAAAGRVVRARRPVPIAPRPTASSSCTRRAVVHHALLSRDVA